MATAIVTEDDIRMFLMDKPEYNTVIHGVRFTPGQIERAILYTVDAFNMTSPIFAAGQYTVETFPYRYLLLIGACGFLLRSAAIGDASNELTYQAEGMAVTDRNKAQIFGALGQAYWEEFKQKAEEVKVQTNLKAARGSITSPYYRLSRL